MMSLKNVNLLHLLDNAQIGVVIHTWNTQVVYANPAALSLLNVTLEHIKKSSGLDEQWEFIDRQNRRLHKDEFPVNKVIRLNAAINEEIVGIVCRQTGQVRWAKVSAYPETYSDTELGFVVVYFTEVTEQLTHFSFEDIVKNAQDMIIVTEAQNVTGPLSPKIIYVNDAICRVSGYTQDELIGETPRIFQGALTDSTATLRIREALLAKESVTETLLNYSKNGTPYWVEMNIFPLKNQLGEVTHFASVERDVSTTKFHSEQLNSRNEELKLIKQNLETLVTEQTRELRNANVKLEKLAYFDALTDIPNRRAFNDALDKAIHFDHRHEFGLLVGIADIDHFKQLNDTYGHGFGDDVLVIFANLLKTFFRQEDGIGRLGGEEFGFCMVVPKEHDVNCVVERLREKVEALPLRYAELKEKQFTVSVGAYCAKMLQNMTARELLDMADNALYTAKRGGRNRVEVITQVPSNTKAC